MKSKIRYRVNYFFVMLILGFLIFIFLKREKIEYRKWNKPKEELCNYLLKEISDDDLSFYCPYGANGPSLFWVVVYKKKYKFHMYKGVLWAYNDLTTRKLDTLSQSYSISKFKNEILERVNFLRSIGVYSIIRGGNDNLITTTYYDSTYEDIKQNNPSYSEKIIDQTENKYFGQPFVLTFVITDFIPNRTFIENFNRVHYLWPMTSTKYYYRRYL
ncbi:hypothetical protein [Chitinophaga sancti]|nr:hypothetical protein [Chitinophaga sancti]WQD64449.1 hypothetical protein U0033_08575 [Chitinophaga sancti]WQG89927.1 hypothetical protein SR876_00345 [Chitinophaga sancti]